MKRMVKLKDYRFKLLFDPLYSPDLAPSDYWLFSDIKRMLQGKSVRLNESYCEESEESADEIGNIPVNPDVYVARNGIEWVPQNSNVPGRFVTLNVLRQSSGPTSFAKHNVNGYHFPLGGALNILRNAAVWPLVCKTVFPKTGCIPRGRDFVMFLPLTTVTFSGHMAREASLHPISEKYMRNDCGLYPASIVHYREHKLLRGIGVSEVGRESVEDDGQSGRPQTSHTAENIEKISQRYSRRFQSADEFKSASQSELKDMAEIGFQKLFDGLYKRWKKCIVTQ
ncbi:uncharacterized protein TNCV_3019231 [Trichonephila clavipes]|nr:uncharacterized protein TNCV_3019231 [Trichonephila clavipes]